MLVWNSRGCFFEKTQQRFDFDILSKDELLVLIRNKMETLPLTYMGQCWLGDLEDLLSVNHHEPSTMVCRSLVELQSNIVNIIRAEKSVGYITGGLEGFHHIVLAESLTLSKVQTLIIGLEQPEFITHKGRPPIFSLTEKISLWFYLAPKNSLVFVIPLRPDNISADLYYDWIVQYLGLWQNPDTIFIGSDDDLVSIKQARQRRAVSGKSIDICFVYDTPHIHTSEYVRVSK